MSETASATKKHPIKILLLILTILGDLLVPFMVLGDSSALFMTGTCLLIAIPLMIGNYHLAKNLCARMSAHPLFLLLITAVVSIIVLLGAYGLMRPSDDSAVSCIALICRDAGLALVNALVISQLCMIGAYIGFIKVAVRAPREKTDSEKPSTGVATS